MQRENGWEKKLALDLLNANFENEIIKILNDAGLWENSDYWRLLGDDENNFKTVGAQQARPEPALVEKLVNSVDARFTAACIRADIQPESAEAPQTIRDAQIKFFSGNSRSENAKGITLAVTGARAHQEGMPCVTICDIGEGQTPRAVPVTFMSIDKKNKLRIPFVQGKFNMGGTGALMFCGRKKFQLLITKRDPEILKRRGSSSNDTHWSITLIRRESPPEGPGQVRNPYFKYLAPINAGSNSEGAVISFEADELDLMPEGPRPYARPMRWGTCIKLYEYDMRGFKGNILRTDGLLSRLEVLLPEIALPVRLHECREGFGGKAGSYDTSLIGLRERLEASKSDSLEPNYPASLTLNIQGQPMTARIYAFKGANADRYRADQGVVFTINGQTHGWFPKSFFERKRVKMGRLAKSLLVVVDASSISVDARADLFKNSRDRLSGGELRRDIEDELEHQIGNHPGLRELRERRRHEEVAEKLNEAKPLEDVLRAILKTSPSLSKLFLLGQRLNSPYRSGGEGNTTGSSGGNSEGKGAYNGNAHPTFFRVEKQKDSETIQRTVEHGRRCRVRFITDVENEYFVRDLNRGRYSVEVIAGPLAGKELTTSVNLYNGIANWSVIIPEEDVQASDVLTLKFTVDDDVILSPFTNDIVFTITPKSLHPGKSGKRNERSGGEKSDEDGEGVGKGSKGKSSEGPPIGIQPPEIHRVRKENWNEYEFVESSACKVYEEEDGSDSGQSVYKFYVNVDNIYLQTDIKQGRGDPAAIEAKFVYGNVLIGLALLHDQHRIDSERKRFESTEDQDGESVTKRIADMTRALSPFLIPMVEYLGSIESETASDLAQAGDED